MVLQVAGWLGVDANLLVGYPTPRSLAAAMRRGEGNPSGPPDKFDTPPGQPAPVQASPPVARTHPRDADGESAEQPPKKRPRLLDVGQAAPVQQGGGDEPGQAVHPPYPGLGGWVLERGGQIRVCPPAAGASSEQQAQQGAAGGGAQWDACARLLQQEVWDGGQAADGGQGEPGQLRLELHWRVRLRECVDAPPLVLMAPGLAPDGAADAQGGAAAR